VDVAVGPFWILLNSWKLLGGVQDVVKLKLVSYKWIASQLMWQFFGILDKDSKVHVFLANQLFSFVDYEPFWYIILIYVTFLSARSVAD
jgi:hypothetical protein